MLVRVDCRDDLDLLDQFGDRHAVPQLGAALETDLRERAINQDPHPPQTAPEQGAGAPVNADAASRERIEGEHRGAEEVAHLVRQKTEVRHAGAADRSVTLLLVRGDGLGDGVVEAAVQRLELVGRDRDVAFIGQLRDALADAPIVMDHLTHRQPDPEQLSAVQPRARGHVPVPRTAIALCRAQDCDELVHEQGQSVRQLGRGGRRRLAPRELRARAHENLIAVCKEKLVKHGRKLRLFDLRGMEMLVFRCRCRPHACVPRPCTS